MRGAQSWVLVAFGPGGFVIDYALYVLTQQKLDKTNADLEHANTVSKQLADQCVQRERNEVNEEGSRFVD
jgi:hypothetical protein